MAYLSGNRLHLRAPEPEDLDILYRWENDPSLWEAGDTVAPYSRYALREYLKSAQEDIFKTRQLRLMVIRKKDNSTIGMIDLTDFDPLHKRAGSGIVIFPDFRQKGYAGEALQIMSEYAFGKLHLHQLYAYINENNLISRTLFSRCGFKETGKLQDWICNDQGKYENVILMQRIKE